MQSATEMRSYCADDFVSLCPDYSKCRTVCWYGYVGPHVYWQQKYFILSPTQVAILQEHNGLGGDRAMTHGPDLILSRNIHDMKCPNVFFCERLKNPTVVSGVSTSLENPFTSRIPHLDCTRIMLPKLVAVVEDKKRTRLGVLLSCFIIRFLTLCPCTLRFFCRFEAFCSLASSTIYFEESTRRKRLNSISSIQCPQSQYRASWNLHQGRRVKSKMARRNKLKNTKEGRLQTRRRQLQQKRRRELQMVIRIVAEEGKRDTKLQKWRKRKIHNTSRTRLQQRRKREEEASCSQWEEGARKEKGGCTVQEASREKTDTELSCKPKTQPDPESKADSRIGLVEVGFFRTTSSSEAKPHLIWNPHRCRIGLPERIFLYSRSKRVSGPKSE